LADSIASTSTPSQSKATTANTTATAVDAKPIPPTTKSVAPPQPAPSPRPKSVKKASFLSSLFCCGSSSAFDEKPPEASTSKPVAKPAPAPALAADNEKAAATAAVSEKQVGAPAPTPTVVVDAPAAAGDVADENGLDASSPPISRSSSAQGGVALSHEETEGVTSGGVMPPGAGTPVKSRRRRSGKTPNPSESIITSVPEPGYGPRAGVLLAGTGESESDDEDDDEEEDEEAELIRRGGVGIPIGEDGLPHPLLDELAPELKGRKCLVLDLDETLVHSSFKMVHQADYVVPVEIENQYHNVYVIKRPGVDGFLKAMGEIYEIVIFTASLSKYADPVLDHLDVHRVIKHRLFRESCYNNKGSYVKDISQLGRPMEECIIIDNSPACYVFHPNNAVPVSSWFNDPHDTELTDLVPFLADVANVPDVRSVLDAGLYQGVDTMQKLEFED